MPQNSIAGLSIVIGGSAAEFARAADRAVGIAGGLASRSGRAGAGIGGALSRVAGGRAVLGMTAAVPAGKLLAEGVQGVASAAVGAGTSALKLAADWQQAGTQFEVMTG